MIFKADKIKPKRDRFLEFEPLEPRILFAADPVATVESLPQEEMVNEEVSFEIQFDNAGADTGYVPYVDFTAAPEMIITDINVRNDPEPPPGSPLTPIGEINASGDLIALGGGLAIDHPLYAGNPALSFGTVGSNTAPVKYDVGSNPSLVGMYVYSVNLPFGSFSGGNPVLHIDVKATLDTLDGVVPGNDLDVFAQGGFLLGETAVLDTGTDPPLVGALDKATIEPQVINLTKTASVPEEDGLLTGENASGPNHPLTYTLAVDVATGETITGLVITDTLPDDLAYVGNLQVRDGGGNLLTAGTDYTLTNEPSNTNALSAVSAADDTITITMVGDVTGVAGNDIVVTYDAYVPYYESDGTTLVVNATTGDQGDLDANEYNDAAVSGTYDHPDVGILPVAVEDNAGPMNATDPDGDTDYRIEEHSLAVQKTVALLPVGSGDNNVTGLSPFDVQEYTMNFQLSDYFAVDNLIMTDVLGDGQEFLIGSGAGANLDTNGIVPTLTFQMHGESIAVNFDAANFAFVESAVTGETTITFNIYQQLIDDAFDRNGASAGGILVAGDALVGGFIPLIGLQAASMGSFNAGTPTQGTVTFRAKVLDRYTDTGTGEQAISQGDTLGNDVTISARNLAVSNLAVIGAIEDDSSSATNSIEVGQINKRVYSITNRDGTVTTPVPLGTLPSDTQLSVGDVITYLVTYKLPLTEFELFTMTDYIPSPIFDVAGTGIDVSQVYAFDATAVTGYMTAGRISYGPDDSFFGDQGSASGDGGIFDLTPAYLEPASPTITKDTTTNSVTITVGDYSVGTLDPVATEIHFLISVEVQPELFADGLKFTNQVGSTESNTLATSSPEDFLAGSVIAAPELVITKGVVSDSSSGGNYSPGTVGPVTFNAPNSATAWTVGNITSAALAADPIDSNIRNLDAGDLVTFVIVVENIGSSNNGAFDVTVTDTLPVGMTTTGFGTQNINLRVTDGNGLALAYTGTLFGGDFELVDPSSVADPDTVGALTEFNATSGTNLVIIAYDLIVEDTASPLEYLINTATITNYSTQEGGLDYTLLPLGTNHAPQIGPPSDVASVRIRDIGLVKNVIDTSYDDTNNLDATNQVAIGEVVTYEVVLTVREGTMFNTTFVDTLDPGLAFLDLVSVVSSSAELTTSKGVGDFSDAYAIVSGGAAGSATENRVFTLGINGTTGLGNIANTGLVGPAPFSSDTREDHTLTITYTAVVLNVPSVPGPSTDRGDLLGNSARLRWEDIDGDARARTRSDDVLVVEPNVTVDKVVSASTAEGAEILRYTITVTNNAGPNVSEAFELQLADILPVEIAYVAASLTWDSGSGNPPDVGSLLFVPTSGPGDPEGTVVASWARLGVGESSTIYFDVRVDDGLTIGTVVTNGSDITYTSLPDTETVSDILGAGNQAYDSERTGISADEGGVANDYTDTDPASFTVFSPASIDKGIIDTSEASTLADTSTPGPVYGAIGEVVRYEITLTIPQATSPDVRIVDTLPPELFWIAAGTNDIQIRFNDFDIAPGVEADLAGAVGSFIALPVGRIAFNGATNEVEFDLGDITNNDVDAGLETVTLIYNAIVGNGAGAGAASAGDVLTNSAQLRVNGSDVGPPLTVDLTVVEPNLTITKSDGGTTTADAGDVITYTLTVTAANGANNTSAFDLSITDAIPDELEYVAATLAIGSLPAYATVGTQTVAGQNLTVTVDELRKGDSFTITFNARVRDSGANQIRSQETVTNTANLSYSSLPDDGTDDGTGDNTTGNEAETPANDPGAEKTYSTSANDPFTSPEPIVSKVFDPVQPAAPLGTSPTNTATIGEEIAYLVTITVPEGITGDPVAYAFDTVAAGLSYVAGSLSVTLGAGVTVGTAGTLDDTNATFFTRDNSGGATAAETLQFDFDRIGFNSGTAANGLDTATIQIRYRLKVDNIIGNQATDVLGNEVDFFYSDGETPATTNKEDDNTPDTDTDVTVVEPDLTIAKVVTTAGVDAGDPVVYTLTITNAAGAAISTAFDVRVQDLLDTNLTLINATVGAGQGIVVTGATVDANASTVSALDITLNEIAAGGSVTVVLNATLDSAVVSGTTIDNTGNITYTSLDGVTAGERDGSDGEGAGLDNYADSDPADFVLATPTIDKLTPTDTTYAIGESVTWDILVTIPEGVTNDLVVTDFLPAGLVYQSFQVITVAAASGGLFSNDFDGTVTGAPTVTNPVGNNRAFNFGQVTVNSDANNLPSNNTFLLRVTSRVDNILGNQGAGSPAAATTFNNTTSLTYTDGTSGSTVVTDPTAPGPISVVEPVMALAKTALTATTGLDAGDTIQYQVVFSNSGTSTAHDLMFSDTLPSGLTVQSIDSVTPASGSTIDTAVNGVGTGALAGEFTVPVGGSVTIVYTVVLGNTVNPGNNYINDAGIAWSSLNGASATERDGDDGVQDDGSLNDYSLTDSVTSSTDTTFDLVKSVDKPTATIGEVLTYTLTLTLNEGTTQNVVLVDTLPTDTGILQFEFIAASETIAYGTAGTTISGSGTPVVSGAVDETLTFSLGNVVLPSGASPDTVTITYQVVVLNVLTNQAGDVESNSVDGTATGVTPDINNTTNVTLVEPQVNATKTTTSVPSNPDAGDTVGYQVVLTSTGGVDAFDVIYSDVLPVEMDLQTGTFTAFLNPTGANTDVSAFFTVTADSVVSVVGGFDLATGDSITISYDSIILPTVTDGLSLINEVDIEWTSLDGTVSGERTGDGDFDNPPNATNPNDYEDETSATVVADLNPVYAFTKEIISTTAAHTGVTGGTSATITDLTIGESVTYRLTASMANGTTNEVIISDIMALTNGVLDIRSVTIVSVGSNLTTTGANAGDAVTIVDSNIDTYGDRFSIDFGTVVNDVSSGASADSQIVIELTAVVVDVLVNQEADIINNEGNLHVLADTDDDGAADDDLNITADVDVEIVEPTLTVTETITAIPGNPDAGDTVSYEIVVDNSSGIDSFDATLSNILPTVLDLQTGTFTATHSVLGDVSAFFTVTATGVVSNGDFDLADGESITITYDTTIKTTVTDGLNVTNDVDIEWTSLPGTEADERSGDGDFDTPVAAANPDDYEDEDETTFVANLSPAYAFTKAIIATSASHTDLVGGTDPTIEDLAIGEEVTYQLTATIANGTTKGVNIADVIALTNGILDIRDVTVVVGTNLTFSGAGTPVINDSNIDTYQDQFAVDFGTVANNLTFADAEANQIIILVKAVVVDILDNQEGDVINNEATFTYREDNNNDGDVDDLGDVSTIVRDVDVELVEPTLTVTETITSIPANPGEGDTVGYEVVVTNTSSVDSFELTFSNVMPPELEVQTGTFTATRDSDGADVSAFFVVTASGVTGVSGGLLDLVAGDFVTINYDTVIQLGVTDGQNIINEVDIEWTSIPGSNLDERTGDGDLDSPVLPTNPDDYEDEAQTLFVASVNSSYDFTKEILSTTAAHTGVADGTDPVIEDLVIGEAVTYRLSVELAGGQTGGVTVSDILNFANGVLDIRNVAVTVGSNLSIGGSTTAAITDSNSDTFNDQVLLNFGTVTNSGVSTLSDDAKIFIDITAVVVDVIENQDGDVINNAATLDLIADPLGTPTPMNFTDNVDVEIVEPTLTVAEAITSIPANPGIGDTVAYEVVIDNSGGIDAFDGTLSNILPPELELQAGTFTAIRDSDGADVSALFTVTSSGVVSVAAGFDLADGDFITINYDTEILAAATDGQTLVNDVDIEWTSIDGPNADERKGDEIAASQSDPVDDYEDVASTNFDVVVGSAYGFNKEVVATSEAHTGVAGGTDPNIVDLVVGEEVTYHLTVDIAVGLADNVLVSDILNLSNGLLDIRSVTVMSVGSNLTLGSQVVTITDSNADPYNDQFTVDFGTVVNDGISGVAGDSRIIIEVKAVVVDVIENQDGDVINNAATLDLDADLDNSGTGETALNFAANVDVEIVEPALTVTETIPSLPANPGIGDTVGYQMVIDNSSGVDAFDGTLSNVLPPELQLQTGTFSAIRDSDGVDVSALFTVTPSGVVSMSGGFDLADGDFITINYDTVLQASVTDGQVLANDVDIEWTSTDGANPDERLGDEIPASASDPVDDYEAADSVNFTAVTVPEYLFSKEIFSTSAAHTGSAGGTDATIEDLAIGESVTYRLTVTLAVGQADNVLVSDIIDLAEGILDIRNVVVTVGGNLAISGGGSVTPVITDSNTDTYDDQVALNFGTVVNSGASSVADASRIYIDITAMVVNIQANQQEDLIDNVATLDLVSDLDGDTVIDDPVNFTDNVEVELVEPILSVTKSVNDTTPQLGDTITYTLLVTNEVQAATTDAFDLEIADTLPAGLVMVPGSATLNILGSPANPSSILSDTSTATGVVILLDRLDEGQSVEIVYNVIVTSDISFIGATLVNNVAMTHTSLPNGVGGINGDERGGTADATDPNDYNADSQASVTLLPPDPEVTTIGPKPGKPKLELEPEPENRFFFDLNQNFLFGMGNRRSLGDFWTQQLNKHLYPIEEAKEPVLGGYIVSGLTQPGTSVRLVVYNDRGEIIGTQTTVADTGGSWMATFNSDKVNEIPARVEVEQTPATHNGGDDSGYDLRTYFAPASSTGTYYSEILSPENVLRKRHVDAVVDLYKAAGSTIHLNWNGAAYEFAAHGGQLNGSGN